MPELPDVEAFKKYFNNTALHKTVKKVDVEDDTILEDISSRSLQSRMKDETFKDTSRHGKQMFVHLDRDEVLTIHFGMTGNFKYYKDEDDKPEYAKIIFKLTNGYSLAYINKRKLGKISLYDSADDFIEDNNLGPDALADLKWEDFKEIIEEKKGKIKSALMDQKTIAGIGNIYSDEILFHAKIHPSTKTEDLKEKDLKEIYKQMEDVLEKGIKALSGEDTDYPKNFLIPIRNEGEECPVCGGKIEKKKIGGRSSYYCKEHQEKK